MMIAETTAIYTLIFLREGALDEADFHFRAG